MNFIFIVEGPIVRKNKSKIKKVLVLNSPLIAQHMKRAVNSERLTVNSKKNYSHLVPHNSAGFKV